MQTVLLTEIPLVVDLPSLLDRLHLKERSRHAERLARMAEEASALARPKALYRPCLVRERRPDGIILEGVRFRSRVLAVNVAKAYRLFPFVATCGLEIETWSAGLETILERFWAETLKERALAAALGAMLTHLGTHHRPGRLSMMNPGSLPDWPLSEQRPLFDLLGDPAASIGVELLDSGFMRPSMSTSGIWFPTDEPFENCMLCPMKDCPGRRAPYDEELCRRKYGAR